jgi:serine/threonine protein kinase/Tol biopolymer transport system component
VTLAIGTKLGPYEVLSQLGAGGMGEVYRAKDPRLGRDVAIKVLPASFAQDSDRLKRFEQEARAAGVLNHPNITAVYDFGSHDGAPYIVTELLEGETLRSRLGPGAIPARKAIDYGIQIAKGLAAAHEKGIVHRDLKPENLFLTKDGRVKILDFGLAKLRSDKPEGSQTDLQTISGTQPGVVLGTMGYMAPEQVRGKPADKRSDLFSFGTILYEMLSGQRAFRGDTAADTITAILTKEPADLSQTNRDVAPGLDRILRHCLEKNPEERFESARDVAFDLEALSTVSTPTTTGVHRLPTPTRKPWALLALAAVLGAAIASPFVFKAGKKAGFVQPPSFRQITFSRGEVGSSLFAPDGQTIVYSAGWEGKPFEIFINRPESPESRPFGLGAAEVLSISKAGEMAVSLNRRPFRSFVRIGRLARISIAGGAPRDILDDVQFADWSPDGQSLAIVRDVGIKNRLEYPIGKVLFETTGWVGQIRVSPKGDAVAFVDHPFPSDDGGRIAIVNLAGKKSDLTPVYATVQGLAWTPDGREIWYTAAEGGFNRAVHAVPPGGGASRLVGRVPGISTIRDISKDGRVLMTNESARLGILERGAGDDKDRELSWLDYSLVTDITPDGQRILITESGEGGGPGYSAYLRKTDGSPAVRLGPGSTEAFSPDGAWGISITAAEKPQIVLLPTSVGEPRALSYEGFDPISADFLPDGKQIVFTGSQSGQGTRLYLRDVNGGKSRAITPEGYSMFRGAITPDGKSIVVRGPDKRIYLYPIAGGEPQALPGLTDKHRPARFSPDGKTLYVQEAESIPSRIYHYDLATGRLELWKELTVADAAGLNSISRFVTTPDSRTYAYSYLRVLSYLQLVEGMK